MADLAEVSFRLNDFCRRCNHSKISLQNGDRIRYGNKNSSYFATRQSVIDIFKNKKAKLSLLDPEKTGVSLDTIQRAASVVGRHLRIELL
jgi:hypothetical protein